ncbi:hypothetical protein M569_12924 [Genlisea aurea]|uniref:Gamma-glutamylcyclotransferase family protein n=1 Tax=Genlisea aurea TaxID=192259 RepID=S8C538_9LAMI|nr:hypothetical protein M569_12924 [Genlisea aurea]
MKMVAGSTLIFTYGTLKRGFANHCLLDDLISTGDAAFVASGATVHALPLVCGPYRVPFLLNFPGLGNRVYGEIYAVSPAALIRIDDLEGVSRGHYERLPIEIEEATGERRSAEAYFAHSSYAEALGRRSGDEMYKCYSEKVASGYVRRRDRPAANGSFMDQIRIFIGN